MIITSFLQSSTSVAVFEIESVTIDKQNFVLLSTTYNNETYYLRSTSRNITLVDEDYRDNVENNQDNDRQLWEELFFNIVGPIV